jgi:hypothetical protein
VLCCLFGRSARLDQILNRLQVHIIDLIVKGGGALRRYC